MADTPQDPRLSYTEGMKWALALAIAAVAGAFLHLSDLSKLPIPLKWLAAAATMAFLVAAFCGVQYLIRLFTDNVRQHDATDLEAKSVQTDEEKKELKELQEKLAKSKISRPKLYRLQTISSCIAAALALIFLPAAIVTFKDDPKKPDCTSIWAPCCQAPVQAQPSPDRFEIVYSAEHPGNKGEMRHTFLLDKQTGALWQMICQKKGVVEFQETQRKKSP